MLSEDFDREARKEFEVSSNEIANGGVQKALVRFYRRHDKLVAEVLHGETDHVGHRHGDVGDIQRKEGIPGQRLAAIVGGDDLQTGEVAGLGKARRTGDLAKPL